MSIIRRVLNAIGLDFRTSPRNPGYWLLPGTVTTSTGIRIDAGNAIENPATLAAVSILADSVASLPLIVYRRVDRGGRAGKERATDHPLYDLLHDRPNQWMSSYTWRETSMMHALLKSNSYSQILKNGGNEIVGIVPIDPDLVNPRMEGDADNPTFVYYVRGKPVDPSRILHVRALSWTGISGQSRIELAAETLGQGTAAERIAGYYFTRGKPPLALKHPGELNDEILERLRKQYEESHDGLENTGRPLILEDGMDVTNMGTDPDKLQLLDSRVFVIQQIARIFNVPPSMISENSHATYSNVEQESLRFVTYSLMPWVRRFEQEINMKCFSKEERAQGYFVEAVTEELLRGDLKSRSDAHLKARTGGWMSINDIREVENMDPIEGGEAYNQPLNSNATEPAEAGAGEEDMEDEQV